MNEFNLNKNLLFLKRFVSGVVALTFTFTSILPNQALAQNVLNLPIPGSVVATTPGFAPAIIKGVNLYPDNPLKFDFIIDQGDTVFTDAEFKAESTKLIKYFLASLTVPEDEMWVNLSPYEKNRIVPQTFGQTEMGRDLLAQDYMLKQLTASLMNPDDKLGGEFWQRVYTKAQEKYGTTDIPMNTFNKIWIVPEKAVVYEHEKGAFVVKSHLKVMLEEDYLALEANKNSTKHGLGDVKINDLKVVSGVQSAIIKDLLIPEIEREVNEGKTFANLRQIYNAVILSSWYKQALKESLLGQIFVDKKMTSGVETDDKTVNEKIYDQYVESFKTGVYNFIKEDYNPETQEVVNRKYFSGGVNLNGQVDINKDSAILGEEKKLQQVGVNLTSLESSKNQVNTIQEQVDSTPFTAIADNKALATYIVRNGETLEQIAFKYNMPITEIQKMNDTLTLSATLALGTGVNVVLAKDQLEDQIKSGIIARSPYRAERNVSRNYSGLERMYHLKSDFDEVKDEPKTVLLIGAGRGVAALEMALQYPNLTIYAVNKQKDVLNYEIAAAKMREAGYKDDLAIEKAWTRIVEKVVDIENESERQTELGGATYDFVLFETVVTVYLQNTAKTIEDIFNTYTKIDGIFGVNVDLKSNKLKTNTSSDRGIKFVDIITDAISKSATLAFEQNLLNITAGLKFKRTSDTDVRIPLTLVNSEKTVYESFVLTYEEQSNEGQKIPTSDDGDHIDGAMTAKNSDEFDTEETSFSRRDFVTGSVKLGLAALGAWAGFRTRSADAVTQESAAMFVANNIRYGFTSLTDPQKAGQAFDKRLDEMLKKYRSSHQGQIVPTALNLPDLSEILNSTPQGASFEQIASTLRNVFSELYKANDRSRLPKLEIQAFRWIMDFWKTNTKYDSFLERSENGINKFMAVYNTISGNSKLSGEFTYVCESFSDLIVLTAHEIGLNENTVSKIPIYEDSQGNIYPNSQGIGHVALLFIDATGKKLFGDQGFMPEHRTIGAWSAEGKFERISGNQIKTRSDLKGETFQQLLETQQAWVEYLRLNDEHNQLIKQGISKNFEGNIKLLEKLQEQLKTLLMAAAVTRRSDLKGNIGSLKEIVGMNLETAKQGLTDQKIVSEANSIIDKHNEFVQKLDKANQKFQNNQWEDASVDYQRLIREIKPFVDAMNQQPPVQVNDWKNLLKGFQEILQAVENNLANAIHNIYAAQLNLLVQRFNNIISILNKSNFANAFSQLQQLKQDTEQLKTKIAKTDNDLLSGAASLLDNIDAAWKTEERNNVVQQFNNMAKRLNNAISQFNKGDKSGALSEIAQIRQQAQEMLLPNIPGVDDSLRKSYTQILDETNRIINETQAQKISSLNAGQIYAATAITFKLSDKNYTLAVNSKSVSDFYDSAMLAERGIRISPKLKRGDFEAEFKEGTNVWIQAGNHTYKIEVNENGMVYVKLHDLNLQPVEGVKFGGQSLALMKRDGFVVGSELGDFIVNDPLLSPEHFSIRFIESGKKGIYKIKIFDLRSLNGTKVIFETGDLSGPNGDIIDGSWSLGRKKNPMMNNRERLVNNFAKDTAMQRVEAEILEDANVPEDEAERLDLDGLTKLSVLQSVMKSTQKHIVYDEVREAALVKDYGDREIYIGEAAIDKGGVCRHQALAIAALLEQFILKGILKGRVYYVRGKGHAWAVYQRSDGEFYVFDVAQGENGQGYFDKMEGATYVGSDGIRRYYSEHLAQEAKDKTVRPAEKLTGRGNIFELENVMEIKKTKGDQAIMGIDDDGKNKIVPNPKKNKIAIHFSWQTYGTLIKSNSLFPQNPLLVEQFKQHPENFPALKEIFDHASQILPGVNFYHFLNAQLKEEDPTLVRLAQIVFAYGVAKEWYLKGNFTVEGMNFTSGGVFPALFLSGSFTLEDGLPFIKDLYDYLFITEGKTIQNDKKTMSLELKGNDNEDIINLIRTIILLNGKLNGKVFLKEIRKYNEVIISGEQEAVEILGDLFTNGSQSRFVKTGQYIVPMDPLGELIQVDERHKIVTSYPDLPIHTPLLQPPIWWNERVKKLNLREPSIPILGQRFEKFSTTSESLPLSESLEEAIFGMINTVGTFDRLLENSGTAIATIGSPQWFVDDLNKTNGQKIVFLLDPNQTDFSENVPTLNPEEDKSMFGYEEKTGGIDLNPTMLNTEIKRNGRGVIIPTFKGTTPDFSGIQGFVPNIINVTPITNLPLLLGVVIPQSSDEKPTEVSYNKELLSMRKE